MFSDNTKVIGDLRIHRFDEVTGKTIEIREIPNLVVQVGKNFIASRMLNTTQSVMSHMAVGTNTVAPVSTNTTLNTEIARVALTSSTNSDNVCTFVASFPSGVGTGALTEAGIFNATPAGVMLARTVFAVVTKNAGDAITITWNITIQ